MKRVVVPIFVLILTISITFVSAVNAEGLTREEWMEDSKVLLEAVNDAHKEIGNSNSFAQGVNALRVRLNALWGEKERFQNHTASCLVFSSILVNIQKFNDYHQDSVIVWDVVKQAIKTFTSAFDRGAIGR